MPGCCRARVCIHVVNRWRTWFQPAEGLIHGGNCFVVATVPVGALRNLKVNYRSATAAAVLDAHAALFRDFFLKLLKQDRTGSFSSWHQIGSPDSPSASDIKQNGTKGKNKRKPSENKSRPHKPAEAPWAAAGLWNPTGMDDYAWTTQDAVKRTVAIKAGVIGLQTCPPWTKPLVIISLFCLGAKSDRAESRSFHSYDFNRFLSDVVPPETGSNLTW